MGRKSREKMTKTIIIVWIHGDMCDHYNATNRVKYLYILLDNVSFDTWKVIPASVNLLDYDNFLLTCRKHVISLCGPQPHRDAECSFIQCYANNSKFIICGISIDCRWVSQSPTWLSWQQTLRLKITEPMDVVSVRRGTFWHLMSSWIFDVRHLTWYRRRWHIN